MTRRCCYCENEFNIKPKFGDKVSHGICIRHYLEQTEAFNLLSEKDIASIRDEANSFCADMSQVFDG